MFDNTTILTISILIAIFSIIISVLFLVMRLNKDKKYDAERNMALIENMRNSFEKSIYELTDRLVASQQRWMDVNHLVINSQLKQKDDIKNSKSPALSEFLKSNGLSENDVAIDKKLVFVLTPFNDRYSNSFEVIQKVCQSVGLKCIRGDEEYIKSDILVHILKQLVKANIVIANLNGRNPNVFYELGIAHALDKHTILISNYNDELPVDLKSKYMILFRDPRDLEDELRKQLLKIYSDIS